MRASPERVTHDGLEDGTWRKLLAATIDAYLAPDFKPRQRVSARKVARGLGLAVAAGSESLKKVELYAPAAAAIRLQTQNWITGTGTQARIRPEWLPAPDSIVFGASDPIGSAANILRKSYYRAGRALELSKTTHLTYYLHRFETLAARGNHPAASLIRVGGTLPFELSRFTTVTADALQETPLTQPLGETERIAAAHQLLQVSTSRAAQHILFLSNIRWRDAERRQPQVAEVTAPLRANTETAEAAGHTALYKLLGEDGKALFPAAMQVIAATTPTLKCPAHQRIEGAESALQTQLHAGINYLGENGMFHPSFTIPSPQ
ncbi:MAG TPA: hypothetical protein VLF62_06565 [Candidatus Saccharimonadales bacterium]|nr:hypothetical protein [Candidatus Saccharimonadales bacterium]